MRNIAHRLHQVETEWGGDIGHGPQGAVPGGTCAQVGHQEGGHPGRRHLLVPCQEPGNQVYSHCDRWVNCVVDAIVEKKTSPLHNLVGVTSSSTFCQMLSLLIPILFSWY